jgi:hypothetical protein
MTTLKAIFGNEKPTIPDTLIASMTDKELKFMAAWNGPTGVTPQDMEDNKNVLENCKPYIDIMSGASRSALMKAIADRRAGVVMHVGNPEQALWKTGGMVYYDKNSMHMVQGSGDIKTVPNTVVPDPAGRRKNGLVPLTIFISSLVQVRLGELKLIHEPQAYARRWIAKNSPFKPFVMLQVVDFYRKAIAVNPVWRTVQAEEATLTNERLVDFVYTSLYDMDDLRYYYLHTFVCFEALCIFDAYQGKDKTRKYTLARTKVNGQFVVPEKAYTVLGPDESPKPVQAQVYSMGYPAVVVYRGGIKPNIKVNPEKDMASAVAAKAMSIATRGSDRSAMSFMCRNAGYSGLAIEEVRTLQRCVAMVGGVIEMGVKQVDVEIASVSHVPVLYTSLQAHFPDVNWVLFMSSESAMKTSTSYASRVNTDRRPGAHLVRYAPYQMKSHSLKKKEGGEELISVSMKNYHEDSVKWRPHVEYSGYTIYTTLFGYYPWMPVKPDTTDSRSSNVGSRSYIDREHPPVPHYVYKFGQTESFCGIVSTLSDFAMMGVDVKVVNANTVSGQRLVIQAVKTKVLLTTVQTEIDWYSRVIDANAAMECYWMHAAPKYSPISNVLVIPKHGISFAYGLLGEVEIVDQGDYVEVAVEDKGQETHSVDQTLNGKGIDPTVLDVIDDDEEDEEEEGGDHQNEGDEQEDAFNVLLPPPKVQEKEKRKDAPLQAVPQSKPRKQKRVKQEEEDSFETKAIGVENM